jgi:GTP-binding protein
MRAIITDIAGTTRELLIDDGKIFETPVIVVDSPGLEHFGQEKMFIDQIIEMADILLFVVDRRQGVSPQEQEIAEMIFKSGKKAQTIVLVNKLENKVYQDTVYEFLADRYSLGFEEVMPISAKQGEGVEELFEHLQREFIQNTLVLQPWWEDDGNINEEDLWDDDIDRTIPFVIVGRPNVGKSSLINALVGKYVAHVQDQPGTTLDYIKSTLVQWRTEFELYDTAGIRRASKIHGLERIAYEKTKTLIEYIKPIVVIVIDGIEWVTKRDMTIIAEMATMGMPLIIALNKADTFDTKSYYDMHRIWLSLKDFQRIKVCTISALEKTGLTNLMQTIRRTWKLSQVRIDTPELNDIMKTARIQSPPRFPKNKICKWKYITHVSTMPHTFYMSVNNQDYANFSFKRRCENVIRKAFELQGIPIHFSFSSKVNKNPYLQKNAWNKNQS